MYDIKRKYIDIKIEVVSSIEILFKMMKFPRNSQLFTIVTVSV